MRYSSYSFLTSALDEGEWSVSRPGRALPPGKGTPAPTRIIPFGRNLASVAVKKFSHFICFAKKFYKICNFNLICEDNGAINCITVQHRKCSFPSTLMGHTTLVYTVCIVISLNQLMLEKHNKTNRFILIIQIISKRNFTNQVLLMRHMGN
jgi:hypothetical protein